jgi:hypothetical protein
MKTSRVRGYYKRSRDDQIGIEGDVVFGMKYVGAEELCSWSRCRNFISFQLQSKPNCVARYGRRLETARRHREIKPASVICGVNWV